jgi:hypothetical protein
MHYCVDQQRQALPLALMECDRLTIFVSGYQTKVEMILFGSTSQDAGHGGVELGAQSLFALYVLFVSV